MKSMDLADYIKIRLSIKYVFFDIIYHNKNHLKGKNNEKIFNI